MTELRLPSRMTVVIKGIQTIVYLAGDNPQRTGHIVYRDKNKTMLVMVMEVYKAIYP